MCLRHINTYCKMNPPQMITTENAMVEKPFRLKGCRYHLLYSGHLSKEIYYNWFRQNLMPRRDALLTLFIANINVNGAQFTKVIFKFNVTIDWKSIDKLDFPIGGGKARPEIRPIYKSNWSAEYMNMMKQDPNAYPILNDINAISARSPKRIKGVSVTPLPISMPQHLPERIEPPITDAVPDLAVVETPTPISPEVSMTDASTLKNKIQDVISEMGILNKLNSLEDLIKSINEPRPKVQLPLPPPVVKEDIIYGIFIEGDASDLVPTAEMPNMLLENKSVLSIRPIANDTKNAIHTTKNSMDKIIDTLKVYGIWFRKYQDKIVMKNTDIMLVTLYIGV
jgi:hypothetical protein